jgi:hypothetical protein
MIVRVADKSKTVKRRRRKVRASKTSARSGQDRPTAETQNQGNLMTQSHGSTVTLLFVTTIARLPKSTPFCRDDRTLGHPCLVLRKKDLPQQPRSEVFVLKWICYPNNSINCFTCTTPSKSLMSPLRTSAFSPSASPRQETITSPALTSSRSV